MIRFVSFRWTRAWDHFNKDNNYTILILYCNSCSKICKIWHFLSKIPQFLFIESWFNIILNNLFSLYCWKIQSLNFYKQCFTWKQDFIYYLKLILMIQSFFYCKKYKFFNHQRFYFKTQHSFWEKQAFCAKNIIFGHFVFLPWLKSAPCEPQLIFMISYKILVVPVLMLNRKKLPFCFIKWVRKSKS